MPLHQLSQKRCPNTCSKYECGQKHNLGIPGHRGEAERCTPEPDSIRKGIQHSEALAD